MIEGLLRHCTDAEIDRQLHRHARRVDRRVRVLPPARLPAAAAAEEHRRRPPLPPRRRRRPARAWTHGADAADPLGADRPAVRPARQVRDRAAARDRRGRAGPAALHPRRPQAPDLPGARGARPRGPDDLPLRLPRLPQLRREIHEGLQVVETLELAPTPTVFYGKDAELTGPDRETPGDLDARAAPAAVRPRARQHAAAPTGARRARAGRTG